MGSSSRNYPACTEVCVLSKQKNLVHIFNLHDFLKAERHQEKKVVVVEHIYNSSTQEGEAGRPEVQSVIHLKFSILVVFHYSLFSCSICSK